MMNSELGFGRKVLEVFEKNGISFEHMPSGIDTMGVIIQQAEFEKKEQEILAGLHRNVQPDSIEIISDMALIAVVGRGMKSTRGTAGRIFSALAHARVNVKMIDQGSSELNIIVGVNDDDFEEKLRNEEGTKKSYYIINGYSVSRCLYAGKGRECSCCT